MNFNSFEFLLFLPIAFCVYWLLPSSRKTQNLWVVATGFFFYGWWDVRFLALMLITIATSYTSGRLIEWGKSHHRSTRWVVWTSALINLGILGIFKYYDFFAESFADIFSTFGYMMDPVTLDLVLPVGISFYTFQAFGYTVDVQRGDMEASHDIVAFAAFISFFPQLVAGPIERARNLLPQFYQPRRFTYEDGITGCRQILWGLFKKIVIADNCSYFTGPIFGDWSGQNVQTLAIGAILFTFQIYCDFSGYGDIAIGTARLFGIRLNRNFATPYFSRSLPEFWTRWHISLSTWFRDYVYIPLGGNRKGKLRQGANIMIVFLLSGLWHGAAAVYVLWGGLHGALQIPYLGRKRHKDKGIPAEGRHLPRWGEFWRILFTFCIVILLWIPFSSVSVADAWGYVARMFGSLDFHGHFFGWQMTVVCLLFLSVEWMTRDRECPLFFKGSGIMRFRLARWCAYYLIVAAILLYPGISGNFIYFQF